MIFGVALSMFLFNRKSNLNLLSMVIIGFTAKNIQLLQIKMAILITSTALVLAMILVIILSILLLDSNINSRLVSQHLNLLYFPIFGPFELEQCASVIFSKHWFS